MAARRPAPFLRGLGASSSIAIGYLPIAFSFGLTAVQAQVPAWATVLISAVVFAGGSQFVLIALLSSAAPVLGTVGAVWLMNVRHLFYGPALASRLGAPAWRLPRPLLAFGLTDEVFAAAAGRLQGLPVDERQAWLVGLQVGAYAAWVAGTLLGVRFGEQFAAVSPVLRETLDFVLPALFFALLLEVVRQTPKQATAAAAAVAAVLLPWWPAHAAMLAGMLGGAVWGARGGDRVPASGAAGVPGRDDGLDDRGRR